MIDGARLWGRLMAMAEIGATRAGGCNRLAGTDADKQARDLFVSWCRRVGCDVSVDEIGNIFARRRGTSVSAPPVVMGSHLDTQPTGGKFDGVFGVLAALEVIETLNDRAIQTRHSLDAVCWTNEEGARFAPAMLGSGTFAGVFALDQALQSADAAGKRLGDELQRIGYAGTRPCRATPIKAALEVHIEQGPILEAKGVQIGVVTGVQGICWYDIVIEGAAVHAGPTPMDRRRDPVKALSDLVQALYATASTLGDDARVTVGIVSAEPGVRNTVPQRVRASVDLRHPDRAQLDAFRARLRQLAKDIGTQARVEVDVVEVWSSPAIAFDPACIASVRAAASDLGVSFTDMVSGAGHDSVYLAGVCPTSMIFIPCKDGVSHNEIESATPADISAGANVLLRAAHALAA